MPPRKVASAKPKPLAVAGGAVTPITEQLPAAESVSHASPPALQTRPYFETIKEFVESVVDDIGKNEIHHGLFIRAENSVVIEREIEAYLKTLPYDCRIYDSLNTRSKAMLEEITSSTISSARCSVFSMLKNQHNPIVIMLKDIDGMAVLEKGAMNTLGKILRAKRTLKQRKEPVSQFPVICVGTFNDDKKTRTLEAGCMTIIVEQEDFKIKKQISAKRRAAAAESHDGTDDRDGEEGGIGVGVGAGEGEGDDNLVPVDSSLGMNPDIIADSNPAKDCVAKLLTGDRIYQNYEHIYYIPGSIRTSVGLIIHENLPDIIKQIKGDAFLTYKHCLETISLADKIDRTVFQKQMPVFNELSSLLKSMRVQMIVKKAAGYVIPSSKIGAEVDAGVDIASHPMLMPPQPAGGETAVPKKRGRPKKIQPVVPVPQAAPTPTPTPTPAPPQPLKVYPHELDFTKILTKYSTQFNNEKFMEHLNSSLLLDSKDSLDFMEIVLKPLPATLPKSTIIPDIAELNSLGISKLDIMRIKKMLLI